MDLLYDRMMQTAEPYLICHPCGKRPLYDYRVTYALEDFLDNEMNEGNICSTYSLLSYDCDGETERGCMTITIMRETFYPETFVFLYERELKTCGAY